ncbi:HPr family phosphocarrier protein [Novosphingobium sp. 9]|uniref:HPr family phosphocarrier protein n=1 Tax=Novosphingobium sp. 9 TaxID=2025349 RepID=UPI0021B4E8F4|nr:HPr family phosphocarrier protein [Novosphingobium sp. 9]
MSEFRETILIVNKRGLHARASAKFVNYVSELPETVGVIVSKDGTEAAGNSILGLMMLGAAKGDTIEIACRGDGAQHAMETLGALVRDGFGED